MTEKTPYKLKQDLMARYGRKYRTCPLDNWTIHGGLEGDADVVYIEVYDPDNKYRLLWSVKGSVPLSGDDPCFLNVIYDRLHPYDMSPVYADDADGLLDAMERKRTEFVKRAYAETETEKLKNAIEGLP